MDGQKRFHTSFPLSLTEDGAWTRVGAQVTKEGLASVPEQHDSLHGARQEALGWPQSVSMCEPLRSVVTRVHGPELFGALHSAARVTRSHT